MRTETGRTGRLHIQTTALVLGLLALLATSPVMAASPPGRTVDYRFGVVEATADLAEAESIGIGFTRVPLFWADLEPSPGQMNLNYTNQDRPYLAAVSAGEALVGVVETVPRWAEVNPHDGVNGVPKGLDLPWNNPANTWGRFMYWMGRHYAGLINTWIIGNELSVPRGPNHTWDGTLSQFAQMVRVAYEALLAANPAAKVLAPGEPYWYTKGRTTAQLLNDLSALPGASTHHDYIDGLNLHLYNTLIFNPAIYARYRALLTIHHLGSLPIWLTEANVAPETSQNPDGATPVQQAAFLVEDLAASFQYVDRVEVYKMEDTDPPGTYAYGMVTDHGAPRLEAAAYRTLVGELTGARWLASQVWSARRGYVTPSTPAVVTFGAPGRLIRVVWDQGFKPTDVVLPAYGAEARVVTLSGATAVIHARDGAFRLPLAPATYNPTHSFQATIGGPPEFINETVPLGTHGTPTTLTLGTPSGFGATPTDQWIVSPKGPPTDMPGPVAVNAAGDQVAIRFHGHWHWYTMAGTAPADLNSPVAAAMGSDGDVYVANAGNYDIVELSPSGRVLATFGGYGMGPGQLLGVSGIAVAPSGDVVVTDAGANRVVEYTSSGALVRAWGALGAAAGQFNGPDGVAVAPSGTIYVADTLNNRVEAFSSAGTFEGQASVADPTSVQWGAGGEILVRDGMDGQAATVSFARSLAPLPGPSEPTALAVGPGGEYAVAATGGILRIYASDGALLRTWTIPPAYGNRKPPNITGMAWNGATLYLVDQRYNRIVAVDTTKPPVPIVVTARGLVDGGTVSVLTLAAGTLLGPEALTVAADGSLWVADTDHRRLVHLSVSGTLLGTVPLGDGPYGVVCLPNGSVAATGYYGGTITVVNTAGHRTSLGFSAGTGPHGLRHPTTLAVLPDGNLVVWDTGNDRAVILTATGDPIGMVQQPTGARALAVLRAGVLAWAIPGAVRPVVLP